MRVGTRAAVCLVLVAAAASAPGPAGTLLRAQTSGESRRRESERSYGSAAEREVALRTVAVAAAESGARPLYARVDLMPDAQGGPLVSELELIEPSLYLRQSPVALDRFVRAIVTAPAS